MKPESKRWLDRAAEDLDHATFLVDNQRPSPGAFHAQQAAEKALKAVLVERDDEFPRIHDLVRLAEMAEAPATLRESAALLSPVYVTTRYPDVDEDLSDEEGQRLLRIAEEVVAWAKAKI